MCLLGSWGKPLEGLIGSGIGAQASGSGFRLALPCTCQAAPGMGPPVPQFPELGVGVPGGPSCIWWKDLAAATGKTAEVGAGGEQPLQGVNALSSMGLMGLGVWAPEGLPLPPPIFSPIPHSYPLWQQPENKVPFPILPFLRLYTDPNIGLL